jgi:hypothetical protein
LGGPAAACCSAVSESAPEGSDLVKVKESRPCASQLFADTQESQPF